MDIALCSSSCSRETRQTCIHIIILMYLPTDWNMFEDQIFDKLLSRFLYLLVINCDSDVHGLRREDGVHSRLKNCQWIGIAGVFSLDGRLHQWRQIKSDQWSTFHKASQSYGTQNIDPASRTSPDYSQRIKRIAKSTASVATNSAEMCQGRQGSTCAPSMRSPWWDAKAATWVD